MPNVIVVPETEDYKLPVSHQDCIWITRRLGTPQLDRNSASYAAPFWISEPVGVRRVYHILSVVPHPNETELILGNSFVLRTPWLGLGQRRRFEYCSLEALGFVEQSPGILAQC